MLTTVILNAGLTFSVGSIFDFSGNALTQVVVDNILAILDTSGVINSTVSLAGGTNATPSASGLVSKANLVGKGWTVFNN